MNTPDPPRVEVTPELLNTLERRIAWQKQRGNDGLPVSCKALAALIERIRELESEVEDWKGAYRSAVHSLENVGKPHSGFGGA